MTEEYRRNETEEMYENIWLFSRPALFSNGRVDRDTLPKGLYAYDLRGHDDDPGTIIDTCIGRYDGKLYYIVESDVEGYTDDPDAYQGEWPTYDCTADQLEKI